MKSTLSICAFPRKVLVRYLASESVSFLPIDRLGPELLRLPGRRNRLGQRPDFLDRADTDAVGLAQGAVNRTGLCHSHFGAVDQGRHIGRIGIADILNGILIQGAILGVRRPKADLQAIGSRIRTLREGTPQEELAAYLHIRQGQLSKIERGMAAPSIEEVLILLCDRFRKSVDWILRGEGN